MQVFPDNQLMMVEMDVSYSDHPYILGRDTYNIRMLYAKTGADRIRFPSRRLQLLRNPSNKVTIQGLPISIMLGIKTIRRYIPLLIMVDAPENWNACRVADVAGMAIRRSSVLLYKKWNSTRYCVEILSYEPHLDLFLNAVKAVIESYKLCGYNTSTVHSEINIEPLNHDFVKRHMYRMDRDEVIPNCQVQFPENTSDDVIIDQRTNNSTVHYTGNIVGVMAMRNHLFNSLPLKLSFGFRYGLIDDSIIKGVDKDYGMDITIQRSNIAVIKGTEGNYLKMFKVYEILFTLKSQINNMPKTLPITKTESQEDEPIR